MKRELRFYLIPLGILGHEVLKSEDCSPLTKDEFIDLAETDGSVYTAEGFQYAYNEGEIDLDDELRIYEVETFE